MNIQFGMRHIKHQTVAFQQMHNLISFIQKRLFDTFMCLLYEWPKMITNGTRQTYLSSCQHFNSFFSDNLIFNELRTNKNFRS